MNKLEFEKEIKKICPWVNERILFLFETYKNFLQEWNKKINLTRLDSDELIYKQYFLNSIIPYIKLGVINKNSNFSLLDIGTGSGIPGLILKIICPNIKLTLLDSNQKKCIFLKELIKIMNISNVVIINERAEICFKNYIEKFDIVTSRAVASLKVILELSIAYTKIGGCIIVNKSNNYLKELADSQKHLIAFSLIKTEEINYIFDNHNYIVAKFIKKAKTSEQFPRDWQKILNKPINK